MPRVKVEIECTIEPNFTGNVKIEVQEVKIDGKVTEPYKPDPMFDPDPTLTLWDILGTDNESLTINLQGV